MCATADHLSPSTKNFLFTYMLYMAIYAKQNICLHLAVKVFKFFSYLTKIILQ